MNESCLLEVQSRVLRWRNLLLCANDGDGELSGARTDFLKVERDLMDETEYMQELDCGGYRTANTNFLDKLFPFVVTFMDRSTKYENGAPMTRFHTRYGEIPGSVTEDMREQGCSKKDSSTLK